MINIKLLKSINREYLTLQEVCAVLGKSRSSVYAYEADCKNGFPRGAKIMGDKVWQKSSIERFIQSKFAEADEATRAIIKFQRGLA